MPFLAWEVSPYSSRQICGALGWPFVIAAQRRRKASSEEMANRMDNDAHPGNDGVY